MKRYQKELAHIQKILKANPRGMTVTDISKKIGINRNSVAKYLDVLLVSGKVEMRLVGPAKLFFLSQRVPISAMLNFASDGILTLDNDLKIVQANDNLLSLMNAEREAILGLSIEDFSHPVLASQEMLSRIREALDGRDSTLELQSQVAETERYFSAKIVPTAFDDGSQGVTLCMEDITERKRAEEELRRSREEYVAVTNLTGDIIVRVDKEGGWTFLNDGACRFWGKPREKLLGVRFAGYLHPEDAEKTTAAIQDSIRTKQMLRGLVNRQKTPEGWRTVEWNGTPIFDDDGNYAGIQATGRDITERQAMEKKLRESEAKTQALFDAIPDLMLQIGKDGTFLEIKPAKEFPPALPPSEFLGRKVDEVMPTEFAQQVMHHVNRALQTGETQVFEYQLPVPLQSQNVRDYEARIVATNENMVLAIVRDITERKRMEEELRSKLREG